MPQVSYNEVQQYQSNRNTPNVSFFKLANNGDKAIVRFAHPSTDTFDILFVHSCEVNGKFRKINCLRKPGEQIEKCPICMMENASNQNSQLKKFPSNRIYLHMIQYTKDSNGNVVATPVVWDRPISVADTLVNYMNEYGDISDMIFTVTRNGAAGDTNTKYDIIPANQNNYPENIYVKDFSAFENYSALGTVVIDRSKEDLDYFTLYGSLPSSTNASAPQQASDNNGWQSVSNVQNVPDMVPFEESYSSPLNNGFTESPSNPNVRSTQFNSNWGNEFSSVRAY